MADKKISQLSPASTSGGSDYIPIVQGGVNLRTNPNILGVNYSAAGLTTVAVGGLPAGSNITNQNTAIIIQQITSPYINPTFTAFAISGQTTKEVGASITGIQSFTWAISDPTHAAANSINIYDLILPQTLVTGHSITSPASFDFSTLPGGEVKLILPGTYSWQIEATDTDVPPVVFTKNLNINWYWLLHYGTSTNTSLNQTQIKALVSGLLTPTTARTYSFAAGGYKYLCVNEDLPQPTSFKDASTGFDIPFEAAVTVSVDNAYSITSNYKVYRSTNILGAAISIIVA